MPTSLPTASNILVVKVAFELKTTSLQPSIQDKENLRTIIEESEIGEVKNFAVSVKAEATTNGAGVKSSFLRGQDNTFEINSQRILPANKPIWLISFEKVVLDNYNPPGGTNETENATVIDVDSLIETTIQTVQDVLTTTEFEDKIQDIIPNADVVCFYFLCLKWYSHMSVHELCAA